MGIRPNLMLVAGLNNIQIDKDNQIVDSRFKDIKEDWKDLMMSKIDFDMYKEIMNPSVEEDAKEVESDFDFVDDRVQYYLHTDHETALYHILSYESNYFGNRVIGTVFDQLYGTILNDALARLIPDFSSDSPNYIHVFPSLEINEIDPKSSNGWLLYNVEMAKKYKKDLHPDQKYNLDVLHRMIKNKQNYGFIADHEIRSIVWTTCCAFRYAGVDVQVKDIKLMLVHEWS